MDSVILLILGMFLVTYIPRLLPFIVIGKGNPNKVLLRFLNYIPYTALGALILPGIFYAIPEKPIAGIVGIVFVIAWTWFREGIILPVLGAMGITYLCITIL